MTTCPVRHFAFSYFEPAITTFKFYWVCYCSICVFYFHDYKMWASLRSRLHPHRLFGFTRTLVIILPKQTAGYSTCAVKLVVCSQSPIGINLLTIEYEMWSYRGVNLPRLPCGVATPHPSPRRV